MDNQIKEVFDAVHAPELLKRRTKAALRKKTFDYGRNVLQLRARRGRLAAGFLTLALVLSGSGLWFLPSASISVDINPSIELKVNALDRAIALKGKNEDGLEVAKHLDVTGMPYDEAVQRILIS